MVTARWVVVAALVGFAASAVGSSWLRLERPAFVLLYTLGVGVFLAAYARATALRPLRQVRRYWRAGLAFGTLAGVVLAIAVAKQPSSVRPDGPALAGSLLWLGLVYGAVDALLLTVVPVLSVYGTRPTEEMRHAGGRLRWAAAAMLASLGVTAAYHLGFAEFRGPALLQPLVGNGLVTLAYLLSGSPLAAVLAHVLMHAAAVLHGMATTTQLPPHY